MLFVPRIEIEDSEAVGISNIISNLITMFPRSVLTALPTDLFTSFINSLTLLTCSFGRSAALEEVVSDTGIAFANMFARSTNIQICLFYTCRPFHSGSFILSNVPGSRMMRT